MEFNDLELAPSKKIVDNLKTVPIDIYKLDAEVVFDVSIGKINIINFR